MPRRNARQRLQKQVVIRRLENIFGEIEHNKNIVLPNSTQIDTLLQCSDEEIVVSAMANLPNVVFDIKDHLPDTMKNEVQELSDENPAHPEMFRNAVTLINIVHTFRMTKEECQTLFPTCIPTWFGSWFAEEISCHGGKVWLPQQEASEDASSGFQSCDEPESHEEP